MTPTEQIDKAISDLADWRGKLMAELRRIIHEADPEIIEEWKWGTPVFSYNGMVCALGAFKDHLKINFLKGASLKDPNKLFNSGFEAKTTRSIDFHEGYKVDDSSLKTLIVEAVEYNKK